MLCPEIGCIYQNYTQCNVRFRYMMKVLDSADHTAVQEQKTKDMTIREIPDTHSVAL